MKKEKSVEIKKATKPVVAIRKVKLEGESGKKSSLSLAVARCN